MRVILISCVSKKEQQPTKAENLYISPWFKAAYAYARHADADKIFILSAEHGLLHCSDVVEPYNTTLNTMKSIQRRAWAHRVIDELSKECDLSNDFFTILAGKHYREYLTPHIKYYEAPLQHLAIGAQVSYLKRNISNAAVISTCGELHRICREAKRYKYPFDEKKIPLNGIYVLFQKEEDAHGGERIVRIGTHTGENQLRSRLKQHFQMENKDRSIFRKNIGRCMINEQRPEYLSIWNLDNTSREEKSRNRLRDTYFENKLEMNITDYIQRNFSFAVIHENSKEKRLSLESKMISTISLCTNCSPSQKWLGNDSPVEKIRESGLWQVNELYKTPLSKEDINYIRDNIL